MAESTLPPVDVREFLRVVSPHAGETPDPFDPDTPDIARPPGAIPPARLRGLLASLAREEREISNKYVRERGTVQQRFVSSGGSHTGYDTATRELYRAAESDRQSLRERWYASLTEGDRASLDRLSLGAAAAVVRPHLPPGVPASLVGPMARLAVENAAIARRAAEERRRCAESLKARGMSNRTVMDALLRGVTTVEREASDLLFGRWLRELTQEQAAALDGRPQAETGDVPSDESLFRERCGGLLSCDEDCGIVRCGDEEYHLTPSQRAVVQYMIDRWEKGRRAFTHKELLGKSGSTGQALRDCFRSNGKVAPAWGRLIVPVQEKKHFYALNFHVPPVSDPSADQSPG